MIEDAASSTGIVENVRRTALSKRERPERANALKSSLTFGWRSVLKIKHVPEQLLDVTLFPIIFTLMFTYLFGGAIAGSTAEYLQFLLPGILVQSVVFVTIYTGVTLNNDLSKGTFDRFRSLPIWRPSMLVGALLGDTVRYMIASAVVLTVGLTLGFRPEGGVTGVLLAVLLLLIFCFGIGWVFTFIAFLMRTQNAVMGLGFIFLFPMTFASNIFVSPETMPWWLQRWVEVNPVTTLVTGVRQLMSGNWPMSEILWVVLFATVLTIIFGSLTMWKFNSRE